MKCQYSPVEGPIMGVPWDHTGIFLHAVPLTCRDMDTPMTQQPSLKPLQSWITTGLCTQYQGLGSTVLSDPFKETKLELYSTALENGMSPMQVLGMTEGTTDPHLLEMPHDSKSFNVPPTHFFLLEAFFPFELGPLFICSGL